MTKPNPLTIDQYQPHIDGLRAVAVLSVMCFHLDFSWIPGGFIGVDVFFVISGYLITKILKAELDSTGNLSLKNFYLRRARRLLPAYLVFLFLVTLAAAVILSPLQLERFGRSLTYGSVGLSNYVFWLEADYFDVSAKLKPLLHTWSLSVEEQFYFIWPGLLIGCYWFRQARILPFVLIFLAALSLLANFGYEHLKGGADAYSVSATSPFNNIKASLFFLTPFRVFEFVIGALLLWAPRSFLGRGVSTGILSIGLLMIAVAAGFFDSDMLFPSYWALLPCCGAALVIYAGGNHSGVSTVITNKTAVAIGLVSYSLYLYHWPVIVFWMYLSIDPLTLLDVVGIVVVSFVCASLSYRYVEIPFRKGNPISRREVRTLTGVVSLLVVVTVGVNIHESGGWQWRAGQVLSELSHYGGETSGEFSASKGLQDRVDIFVVGDSHGKQYMDGIVHELASPNNLTVGDYAGTSCFHLPGFTRTTLGNWDESCPRALNRALHAITNQQNPSVVILSHYWVKQLGRSALLDVNGKRQKRKVDIDDVLQGLHSFKNAIGDSTLVVIGQIPTTNGLDLGDLLTRPTSSLLAVTPQGYETTLLEPHYAEINRRLDQESQQTGDFVFVDPSRAFCDEMLCKNIDEYRTPYYSDPRHLSKLGSRKVISDIAKLHGAVFSKFEVAQRDAIQH